MTYKKIVFTSAYVKVKGLRPPKKTQIQTVL
jgi:hypothetical protein